MILPAMMKMTLMQKIPNQLASYDGFGLGVYMLRYLRLRKLHFLKNQKNV